MSAPFNLRTKVIFGLKQSAVSDTALHLCSDTFPDSEKNVYFRCYLYVGCFTCLYLHSFDCVQETKFEIWMSFSSSHLCSYWNFHKPWCGRMLKRKRVTSPQLFTQGISVVCSVCVHSLEKLDIFCYLGSFLEIKHRFCPDFDCVLMWLKYHLKKNCFSLDSNLLFTSDTVLLWSVNDLLRSKCPVGASYAELKV